jgi:hypothetical protein
VAQEIVGYLGPKNYDDLDQADLAAGFSTGFKQTVDLGWFAFIGRPLLWPLLPAAAQRVLAAREQLVEVLDELGVAPGAVIDNGVVVIAHRARQQDVDLGAQRGGDQTVEEGVVGRGVGAEQELALGAAAGDQVELARKHRSGKHALAPDQDLGLSIATRSRAVWVARVRWPAIASEIRTKTVDRPAGAPP